MTIALWIHLARIYRTRYTRRHISIYLYTVNTQMMMFAIFVYILYMYIFLYIFMCICTYTVTIKFHSFPKVDGTGKCIISLGNRHHRGAADSASTDTPSLTTVCK